jgi:hypothetical protein
MGNCSKFRSLAEACARRQGNFFGLIWFDLL